MIKIDDALMGGYAIFYSQDMRFYNSFLLGCNFVQSNKMSTIGIRATFNGFEIIYNSDFLNSKNKFQVAFILIHEIMHAISNHQQRTGNRDLELANKVADMIINSSILEEYNNKIIQKPDEKILEVPKEYSGKKVFEYLYDWIKDNQNEKQVKNSISIGTLDEHLEDEVPEEVKSAMVENFINKMKVQGYVTNDIENLLEKLKPKKNNYMSMFKRYFAMLIGKYKKNTWKKPNRKLQNYETKGFYMKGYKKYKQKINFILDVSGSMDGYHTKVLNNVANNNIEMNLIQNDTEVKQVDIIKSINQLQRIKIKGLGGSVLQPAINYIKNKFNNYPTIILTDGWIDTLDLLGIKKDIIVLTTEKNIEFTNKNISVKQILLKDD